MRYPRIIDYNDFGLVKRGKISFWAKSVWTISKWPKSEDFGLAEIEMAECLGVRITGPYYSRQLQWLRLGQRGAKVKISVWPKSKWHNFWWSVLLTLLGVLICPHYLPAVRHPRIVDYNDSGLTKQVRFRSERNRFERFSKWPKSEDFGLAEIGLAEIGLA